jgi:hypothetical protein
LYSVKQRIYLNTLILIFKIKNNMVPGHMNEDNFKIILRNADDFRLPTYKKTGLKLFDELKAAIKQEIVLDRFRGEKERDSSKAPFKKCPEKKCPGKKWPGKN